MADLTDTIASNAKIQELEKELSNLKNNVEGPKFLYDQTSQIYALDPKAYYDPTMNDKIKRIQYLEERIATLNKDMQRSFAPIHVGVGKMHLTVQNFKNKNKENTNKFIGDSYYYQVGKSPPAPKQIDNSFIPIEHTPYIKPEPKGRVTDASLEKQNFNVKIVTKEHIEDKTDGQVYYDNRKDLEKMNAQISQENSKKLLKFSTPAMAKDLTKINEGFQSEKIQAEAGLKK